MPSMQQSLYSIESHETKLRVAQNNSATIDQPHWYASYTCSRQEKRICKALEERQVHAFLPLYQKLRRHNRGTRRVHLPLFPGYIFVRIPVSERVRVLEVPGIVQLVSFRGDPVAIDDMEIESIRRALAVDESAHPCAYIKVGQTAIIESGPLQGLRGRLLRSNSNFRAVLSVELLQKSFIVNVDERDLAFGPQPVRPSGTSRSTAA
jgi:transcription antitermination factor NusG